MDAAPKTKGHVKALMHRLYEKAMLWEMVEWQRNPMQLVEIKGISKRQKKPIVLTVERFYQILELLPQPYRTMVVVAQCTGLRAEEVLALEWQDIDFENLSMRVVRAVVSGRVCLSTKASRCRSTATCVGNLSVPRNIDFRLPVMGSW